MTLSKNHKVVIKEFRKGTAFYFSAMTSYHPYTQGSYGSNAKMIHGTILKKLESLGLIYTNLFYDKNN